MVRGGHVARVAKLALPLLRATSENVALEDAREFELAGGGTLEAFLRTGVGFNLGHSYVPSEGWFLCPTALAMTSAFDGFLLLRRAPAANGVLAGSLVIS